MTKKLEQLFDLPSLEITPDNQEDIHSHMEHINDINDAIDKIDAALPGVRDLEVADGEMDELATMATDKFNDLMDLGMNVEARYAGAISDIHVCLDWSWPSLSFNPIKCFQISS